MTKRAKKNLVCSASSRVPDVDVYADVTALNPILNGGGYFYLKCHLSLKISRIGVQRWGQVVSKFKLGHMGYSKTVFGFKKFFRSDPGAHKFGPPEK